MISKYIIEYDIDTDEEHDLSLVTGNHKELFPNCNCEEASNEG